MTFEELVEIGYNRPIPPKERFTCNECPDKDMCEFAWDLYNTDGDCLLDK